MHAASRHGTPSLTSLPKDDNSESTYALKGGGATLKACKNVQGERGSSKKVRTLV